MEAYELAEARERAEATELAALEAEDELQRFYQSVYGQSCAPGCGPRPNSGLAQLRVKADLLRALAFRASMAYHNLVDEDSDPAYAQREQAAARLGGAVLP